MNKPALNPFTGLKGALAGLMSGGWLGLLLHLLFQRRIAPMLAALESLFAQFTAGTLPLPAVPVRTIASPPATRLPATAPRIRRPGPAARVRRQPVPPAAKSSIPQATWDATAPPHTHGHAPYSAVVSRPRARCRKNPDGAPNIRTPYLFR